MSESRPFAAIGITGEIIELDDNSLGLPGRVTRVGLLLPPGLPFGRWLSMMETLKRIEGSIMWWLGDCLNYGELTYGEAYSQALDTTGKAYTYQTLADAKWVSGKILISRRREMLSFRHHREVVALPEREQERILTEAERGEKSSAWVRQRVKEHNRAVRQTPPDDLPALPDRCALHVSDVANLSSLVPAGSIDWVITDPPYPKEYLDVYDDLANFADHALKLGGSCLVMCGQSYLLDIGARLQNVLNYHWEAAYLTPGGQSVQLWDRKVNTFWKPLLWFVKGEYEGDWIGDVSRSDHNDKRFHKWGQSESGMLDIIRRFTRAGDIICDPFLGAGTTGLAALALDRIFIGADISEDAVMSARWRISEL